ncbi:MAG: SCP2 sterol-binding domain-containing protein [Deltaproteobacteria bacterium]|nr:SCP2 sterol-binding domain-containing protein [Deltaproteobacteria bacterium]MBW1923531.1 SCP2 sterol-binding domain-containing protein [Deltaproteobacteria bacterium]MBW2102190.1 SCP2 sterol-binding domain-containing protein [Deltaproteobacteria bacterium]MBW2349487.1 SCP2 sterol-binding domain-containing protein [Deltaproteobacteria bacterium]
MAEKFQYLSPEWRDEAERRLKAELSPERMNHITSSMSNIYLNCPEGKKRFLFFKFDNGELSELLVGDAEPPEAEFRITGDYDVFARITRCELGSQKALMTRKLKLKGNMIKALKLASVADRLNKVLSGIPTEF